ncbi:hypothetical protein EI42_00368 [Thermosporothrix hazakensis]|jgi:hypothetical protein|uniref:Uncharacterized protein n=1 Tax=Thermosporothrix hazakensis TaxID=644383 RepID=A0A326UCZ7_THEHA|nr:hypothetical protein EI42_00368 [Thermosporothrix hazakensis]
MRIGGQHACGVGPHLKEQQATGDFTLSTLSIGSCYNMPTAHFSSSVYIC